MRSCVLALFLSTFGIVASGKEYFVLQGIDKTHPDDVITATGVDGFTIRVSWKKLHEEGFSWLDEQINRGDSLGVDIQLRVMAGANAPANLAGVSYFDYLADDESGATVIRRAPVPWDANMQLHWQVLTSELSDRYGGNSHIKVIHVPSFANSSELHMPVEVSQLAGYSSRVLAESWAAMATPLAAAFPQAIVSLNYATPTQSQIAIEDSEWLVEELAVIAGDRAGYQANDLSANTTLDRPKYETIVAQHELGRNVGFQMVSSSYTSRFGGGFLEAVGIASQAGAQWLEIYAADIPNIPSSGDYNLDGKVDAADYSLWRKTLQQTGASLAADGNNDGRINQGDYDVWRANFGQTIGAGGGGAVGSPDSTNAVVPEATSVAYLICLGFCLAFRRPALASRSSN